MPVRGRVSEHTRDLISNLIHRILIQNLNFTGGINYGCVTKRYSVWLPGEDLFERGYVAARVMAASDQHSGLCRAHAHQSCAGLFVGTSLSLTKNRAVLFLMGTADNGSARISVVIKFV